MNETANSRAVQKKILFVATVSYPFNTQLKHLILFLQEEGWDTHVLCSDKPNIQGISFHPLDIAREISPIRDITSLFSLFLFLKRNRFSIVHSFNPKSGLLCSIAAKLAGAPVRLHTYTGQVWVTLTGFKKMLAKNSDKVIGILNSKCYCDSFSQKEFLVKEGVILLEKLTVLAGGSLSGVDLKRFNRARFQEEELVDFRKQLNLSSKDFVLLFVGRITRDKGIKELIAAYQILKVQYSNIKLLVVGPEEADATEFLKGFDKEVFSGIRFEGYKVEPEKYMAISDLFVLPSYREGFGSVIIQANAMGLTSVGTNIPGLRDAIVDQCTGVLVQERNIDELVRAIGILFENEDLRQKLSDQAISRVCDFSSEKLNVAILNEYNKLVF